MRILAALPRWLKGLEPRKRGKESDLCTGRMFHTKSQTEETVGKDWHSRLVGVAGRNRDIISSAEAED
jgi:hypothetical protein